MMSGLSIAPPIDRAKFARISDALIVAVAASLPWSTSATSILLVIWLLALIPTLEWADVRRELTTLAGGLPVLLFLFGLFGMAWADVSLIERWNGLDAFFKLLVIPLLFTQIRRSDCALWVFGAYLISCVVLLFASMIVAYSSYDSFIPMQFGLVLVKNASTQSGEFVTCIFGLLFLAFDFFWHKRWILILGASAIIVAMLANIFFLATGRTALVIIPILLVLFAARNLSAKGFVILIAGAAILGTLGWMSSWYLRFRVLELWTDVQQYEATDERNSSSERIVFWKNSLEFIREAPIIGHGTGTIHSLFEKSASGQLGPAALATTNPHNQTFTVAIQLGAVGAIILWAMWIAHLLLFRGNDLVNWIGLVIVVQNIVGSLFNSHLFDFTQGWVYVLGVGVAGGVALKNRRANESPSPAT